MKSKFITYIILLILLVNTANAGKYFVLDVNHIFGSVTFNSINLKEVDRTIKYADKSGFLIKTVSFENSGIQTIYYSMSENKNYLIYIPYNENAARIEVYNSKNSKIIDIDVGSFASTCGNKICEEHESYESCTKDCASGSKDDFCDGVVDGICDSDCPLKADDDCEERFNETSEISETISKTDKIKELEFVEENSNYLIWVSLISISIVFVSLFLFVKKRKENQIITSLKQYINKNLNRGFTLQQIKDSLFREGYTQKEIDKAIKSI